MASTKSFFFFFFLSFKWERKGLLLWSYYHINGLCANPRKSKRNWKKKGNNKLLKEFLPQ